MSGEKSGRDRSCRGAEGEVAVNSQAKGPDLDDTLERGMHTQEAILSLRSRLLLVGDSYRK